MGYDKESYARIRSGIMYALNEFANDGHCFAKKDELVNKASELLGLSWRKWRLPYSICWKRNP